MNDNTSIHLRDAERFSQGNNLAAVLLIAATLLQHLHLLPALTTTQTWIVTAASSVFVTIHHYYSTIRKYLRRAVSFFLPKRQHLDGNRSERLRTRLSLSLLGFQIVDYDHTSQKDLASTPHRRKTKRK